jgi:hypothetical protein
MYGDRWSADIYESRDAHLNDNRSMDARRRGRKKINGEVGLIASGNWPVGSVKDRTHGAPQTSSASHALMYIIRDAWPTFERDGEYVVHGGGPRDREHFRGRLLPLLREWFVHGSPFPPESGLTKHESFRRLCFDTCTQRSHEGSEADPVPAGRLHDLGDHGAIGIPSGNWPDLAHPVTSRASRIWLQPPGRLALTQRNLDRRFQTMNRRSD